MKDLHYVLANFFTHKDYLVPANQIPGTIFTPLSYIFEVVVLAIVVFSAIYVAKHKKLIKPVFTAQWVILLIWEFAIIAFDSLAGKTRGLDYRTSLSLYPCSIFLYVMPLAIWGHGDLKKIACGYVCTLGMLGGAVNFLLPVARLSDYSCLSFAAFHTFAFHGTMVFTFLVMLLSGYHSYGGVTRMRELFYPCIPSLLMSIPANILNYSPLHSDYMYFRGDFFLLQRLFHGASPIFVTITLYALYILIPALFYFPSYLRNRQQTLEEEAFSFPELEFFWEPMRLEGKDFQTFSGENIPNSAGKQ